MVDIQAKEIIDKIFEELKIQPALKLPTKIGDKINLVYSVNPQRDMQVKSAQAVDTAVAGGIHTTSLVKDTYFVGGFLSVSKDVVSNSILTELIVTPKGKAATSFIRLRYEPLTAGDFQHSIILPHPILLERGSAVQIQHNSGTASIDGTGIAYFYEVDPI